ncbi:hypothetical protein J690_2703 [Acinetobacter sp. 742879]|nr:hypothetical protein ACINWC136_1088 [Acinetobacter pittii]EXE26621.1 hypothetical protein J569_1913 [Acinetobacter sp. 907131]EXG32238.1 hypothetical protein J733_1363 [Acinetobacter sp. 263903-2]EXH35908.1 hypothetical protein J623_0325 [Acinetobacter sp. 1245249]EXS16403.1 hypothetical protein J672_1653 [Acinetobacter sp. 883425]EXS27357.1 hypothetical protein J690_2703 [Acinetobacter sp. 742879]EYT27771.1 hypothetical protein J622_01030 [Acinetobacter sp. 1564232]
MISIASSLWSQDLRNLAISLHLAKSQIGQMCIFFNPIGNDI